MLKQVAARYHQMGWPTNGGGGEGSVLQASYQTECVTATHTQPHTHTHSVKPAEVVLQAQQGLLASTCHSPITKTNKVLLSLNFIVWFCQLIKTKISSLFFYYFFFFVLNRTISLFCFDFKQAG